MQMLKSKKKFQKLKSGQVYLLDITLFFIFLSITISIIEILLHYRDDDKTFMLQNAFFLSFTSTVFVLLPKIKRVEPRDLGGWNKIALSIIICTTIVLMIQAIIGYFLKARIYLIYDIEIYLFYINAAISEEFFYRVFIINIIFILAEHVKQLRNNQQLIKIIAIFTSATIFSLSHLRVYFSIPLMLLSTFLGGLTLSTFYVYTRNPLVPIIAHVINNAIAAGVIITNCILVI